MRLNKEQKAFSAVDPESVGFNRLQFKSPKMKTGLLCDRAEIKELFNSSSKVSESLPSFCRVSEQNSVFNFSHIEIP